MNSSILDQVQDLLQQVDATDRTPWPRGSDWNASVISQRAQLRELLRQLAAYHSGFAVVATEHRALLKQLKSFTEERPKADGTSSLGLQKAFAPRLVALLNSIDWEEDHGKH